MPWPRVGRRWDERGQAISFLSCQGTTGSPKGATLSHYNIVNNANMIGQRLRLHQKVRGCWPSKGFLAPCRGGGLLDSPCWLEELGFWPCSRPSSCFHLQTPEESRIVLPSPLYHCLGSVGGTMVSLMHGITLILCSPVFEGKKTLEAVSRERWASVGSYLWAYKILLFLIPGP